MALGKWGSTLLRWRITRYTKAFPELQQRMMVVDCFTQWRSICGLNFLESTGDADIHISFEKGKHGDTNDFKTNKFEALFNEIGHAFIPPGDRAGTVHMNVDYPFDARTLRLVFLHEIGHALGLGHSGNIVSVM